MVPIQQQIERLTGKEQSEVDTETLIMAAAQIASGMMGKYSHPTAVGLGDTPKEIAAAAVAVALAIEERARDAMAD